MEQKIIIPEGFELKQINESEYAIVKKETPLPETWEEFCENYGVDKSKEVYINGCSEIRCPEKNDRRAQLDKNYLPNHDYAEAILALCQLIQLRDCYHQGWKPDWTVESNKSSIVFRFNEAMKETFLQCNQIFSFQSVEVRDKFFKNFKSLIDKTKPLFI